MACAPKSTGISCKPYPITVTDGTSQSQINWPHVVNVGDSVIINNTTHVVTAVTTTGSITGSTISIVGGGGSGGYNWIAPTPMPQVDISDYLPSKEATKFFTRLLKDHASDNDIKEMMLILFDSLGKTEKENIKISPEVVTALLTFCIEKYA